MDNTIRIGVDLHINTLSQHVLITGNTGTGKTTTIFRMLEQLEMESKCINIVFDSKGDLNKIKQARGCNVVLIDTDPNWQDEKNFGLSAKLDFCRIPLDVLKKLMGFNEIQGNLFQMFHDMMLEYVDDNGRIFDLWREVFNPELALKTFNTFQDDLKDYVAKKMNTNINNVTYNAVSQRLLSFSLQFNKFFYTENEKVNTYIEFFDQVDAEDGATFIINTSNLKLNRNEAINSTIYQLWVAYILNRIYDRYEGESDKLECTLFIDEAHQLFTDNDTNKSPMVGYVLNTVRTSRSRGLGLVFITQSTKDIPSDITSQVSTVIQHRLTKDDLIKDIANSFKSTNAYHNKWGDNTNYITEIKNLNIGEAYISCLDEKGNQREVVKAKIDTPQSIKYKVLEKNN